MKSLFIFLLLNLCSLASIWGQDTLSKRIKINMQPESGFYKNSVTVEVKSTQKGARLYYTTNGATPSSASRSYRGSLTFDTTTVLKVASYLNGKRTKIETNTYFIGEDSIGLPVMSLSITPAYLFDPVKGVFKRGPNASSKFPHKGANYYSRREFAAHIEFFDDEKKLGYENNVGFKVFGGMSRIFPQKSFSVATRKKLYGDKRMKYKIFPDKKLKKYKHIVFRNSGSDFGGTHFRDALITSLGEEMGLEVQGYRPCVTFINGEYWGIYNLREKLNKHYIEGNFGYDKDSIDLLEHSGHANAGTSQHYKRMRKYMKDHDLSIQAHFDSVAKLMDVNNFMEYQIIEIFINNEDAGGNIKFWRPHPDGKWRWILFDTDFGLGHYGGLKAYKFNSMAFHTRPNGPKWPNPPWSTFNLRMLLKNKGFRTAFISRFLDRMNSTLSGEYINKRIDHMIGGIENDLPRHMKRWDLDTKSWERKVGRMRDFANERGAYIRKYIREMYPYVGDEVKLEVRKTEGGKVYINDLIELKDSIFNGVYFTEIPVKIKAQPYFGYQFSHWEDSQLQIKERACQVRFTDTLQILKAVFVKGEHPAVKKVIINEISCKDTLSGDWVELYNSTAEMIQLKDWIMKDKAGNTFVFPEVSIEGGAYLVVCQDEKRFKQVFAQVPNVIGDFKFGLSAKKENIELYDSTFLPVDSVSYKIPKQMRKKKFVLGLIDYKLDNSNFGNWKINEKKGSPGSVNPAFVKKEKKEQMSNLMEWVKIGGIALGSLLLITTTYILYRRRMKIRK
ncbi:MAG: CotH kinase family protein [Saprospiraceae bacterium]|nr:CotH kinase family protein [Saprospiraceae bacterium]